MRGFTILSNIPQIITLIRADENTDINLEDVIIIITEVT
jgi:hypothetical protein